MAEAHSYLLCGTPRTGSTLLCSLLRSTGVLGRPESYFREPDEAAWSATLGLPDVGGAGDASDYRAFVHAVRAAATTPNGVFAARVMWGAVQRMVDGLHGSPSESDLAVLERALGRLEFVYVRRLDAIGQAVSWCRAEQTGFWQDGDATGRLPSFDLAYLKDLLSTIGQHNAAWQRWFQRQHVRPLVVTYEEVVQQPESTVDRIETRISSRGPTEPVRRGVHPHGGSS